MFVSELFCIWFGYFANAGMMCEDGIGVKCGNGGVLQRDEVCVAA
jgi:hypothetical protein